ncbi:2-hydroxyacyl-CoA dehydratase subunit D [Chloroflexota bacterium]
MIEYFREYNRSFPDIQPITEFKSSGKQIFGWVCTYVPEEVIHAAGALPVRVTGYSSEEELDEGNAYLYVNNCSFSRSCLQMAAKGGYSYLDGLVAGSTCDGARRLFDVWAAYINTPFRHILTVPRKYDDDAHALYYKQVVAFKEKLEQYIDVNISDGALHNSISTYNESRTPLKQLYELRKLDNPPITGAETMEVLIAGFRMPKEMFNQQLKELLQKLNASGKKHSSRARLLVTGSVLSNPEFIASIEALGVLVVTDELCTSTRYWSDPVVVKGSESLLAAISRRYLNNFPCARMFPSDERFNRILDLTTDFRVDGVISEILRYCVPYAHDLPLLSERLKERGIPTLALDLEYGTSGSGQVRTRVQAFIEMLEAKKK